jgi:hypothetical protein
LAQCEHVLKRSVLNHPQISDMAKKACPSKNTLAQFPGLQVSKKRTEEPSSDVIVTSRSGQAYSVPSIEDIRRMEADLKRKTDLLVTLL